MLDVLPCSSRINATETFAAARALRRSNHFLEGFDPFLAMYSLTCITVTYMLPFVNRSFGELSQHFKRRASPLRRCRRPSSVNYVNEDFAFGWMVKESFSGRDACDFRGRCLKREGAFERRLGN